MTLHCSHIEFFFFLLRCDIPSRPPEILWVLSSFIPSFDPLFSAPDVPLLVLLSACGVPLSLHHLAVTCCCAVALSTQNPDTEPTQSSSWGQDRIKHPSWWYRPLLLFTDQTESVGKVQVQFHEQRPQPWKHRPLLVIKNITTTLSFLPSFTHWKSAVSRFLSSFLPSLPFSCLFWLPRCRRAKTLIPSFAPLTGRAHRSRCLAGLCLSGPPRCRDWLLNHRYSSYKFFSPCCAGPCEATCLAGQCSCGFYNGLTTQQCICGCSFHFLIAVRIEQSVLHLSFCEERQRESSLKCCFTGLAVWSRIKNLYGIL